MTFNIKEWNEDTNLDSFYQEAKRRGFENNSSQERMIDTFRREREWKCWILYKEDTPIGSVVSHSFDLMGRNAYRVLARTCCIGQHVTQSLIKPQKLVSQHQNLTDQFLLPACLEWAKGDCYSTSNNSPVASQRLVHKYYFPTLQEMGIVDNVGEVFYRKTLQTVWKIYPDRFFENLNRYPRWT